MKNCELHKDISRRGRLKKKNEGAKERASADKPVMYSRREVGLKANEELFP